MPIYAYRCETCGFEKDHLQKLSDPVLSVCPKCERATYTKQVTAAGFQLKGNGWYVTDFKGGSKAPSTTTGPENKDSSPTGTENATSSTAQASASGSSTSSTKATTSADSTPAGTKSTAAVKDKG
ncbi:MAG: FmdB family transcriptional regulator [Candidatus Accumulibacter phosphatis]|uniref:FmdB family transcriptional regulator n=1 Tax=Candidatus Accumulibacter phosphatis TaxID=327160 RepID=A0A6A7RRK6_9PROT|nr:FmdB family transcriptional regulator [Candidatus Accumulibacter phosphatis]